jgi:hypothetical protein
MDLIILYLIMPTLIRAVRVLSEMAIFTVRVDAIDRKSQAFYLKYGFIQFQDEPLSLLLPMKTIIASIIIS